MGSAAKVKRSAAEIKGLVDLAAQAFMVRYQEEYPTTKRTTLYERRQRARSRAFDLVHHCLNKPVTDDG